MWCSPRSVKISTCVSVLKFKPEQVATVRPFTCIGSKLCLSVSQAIHSQGKLLNGLYRNCGVFDFQLRLILVLMSGTTHQKFADSTLRISLPAKKLSTFQGKMYSTHRILYRRYFKNCLNTFLNVHCALRWHESQTVHAVLRLWTAFYKYMYLQEASIRTK
jgi:hypothetical protein